MKKIGIVVLFCGIILGLTFSLGLCQADQEDVKIGGNWKINESHAFIYIGIEKGFFKEAGFNVEFVPGKGSGPSIATVDSGIFYIGLASASSFLEALSKNPNTKVRVVANFHPRGITGLFYNKKFLQAKNAEVSAQDFAGKTLGVKKGSLRTLAARIYFAKNGVPFTAINEEADAGVNAVRFIGMPPGKALGQVMAEKLFSCTYAYSSGVTTLKLAGMSDDIGHILLDEVGVIQMGLSIIVNVDYLIDNQEKMARLVKAVMKSFNYADENPEETIEVFNKLFPQKKLEALKIAYPIERHMWRSEETKGKPLGTISLERLLKSQQTMIDGGRLSQPFSDEVLRKFYWLDYIGTYVPVE
jgi:NitT/TauT family transport system substrate-binding protein